MDVTSETVTARSARRISGRSRSQKTTAGGETPFRTLIKVTRRNLATIQRCIDSAISITGITAHTSNARGHKPSKRSKAKLASRRKQSAVRSSDDTLRVKQETL
nr:hypothetical protein [Crucivirus sp.]